MSTRSRIKSNRNSSIRARSANGSYLPSYAQPTISFSRRASNDFISYSKSQENTPLKAGISKVSTIASKNSPTHKETRGKIDSSRNRLKNQPSFTNLFSDAESIADDRMDVMSSSGKNRSFRSPTLAKADVKPDAPLDIESLIKATTMLMNESTEMPPIDTSVEESYMKALDEGRHSISIEDWEKVVERQAHFVKEVKEKSERDQSLINNVLELNNAMSMKVNNYKSQLESARREIGSLKEALEFQKAKHEAETFQGGVDQFQSDFELSPFISQANSPLVSNSQTFKYLKSSKGSGNLFSQ